jgi:predicted Abi (CAAX) family protease
MFVLSQSRCCEASVAITSKVVEPLINNHYNPVNRQVDGALTRGVDCWCVRLLPPNIRNIDGQYS